MNRLLKIISIVTVLTSCNSTPKKANDIEEQKTETSKPAPTNDTTPKVTGIGGIFFFSDNPKETKEWYGKNLGLAIDDYGSPFEFRNANRPDERNYLRWSPFDKKSDYFNPSKKDFMINYRVQNIEGLAKKLKENGTTILDTIATYDYGKFVHILDPEGNKIELWEPIDSVLTKMGGKTTK
jgi:predicted enzyme related to lactoylglutathione lyase